MIAVKVTILIVSVNRASSSACLLTLSILTANTSTTANNQTISLSFFNPYTEIALPTITTTSATTELSYTATQDKLYTNYEFTLTTPSLFNFSLEQKIYNLALF